MILAEEMASPKTAGQIGLAYPARARLGCAVCIKEIDKQTYIGVPDIQDQSVKQRKNELRRQVE